MAGKQAGQERKNSRHWLILASLPDGIGGKRADQIARDAGCSVRTVYRDLDMLIGAGFPVEKEKTSRGTIWRLAKGFRSFPPMPFSPVEAAALVVAERRLRAAGDIYFAELLGDILARMRKGRGAELAAVLERLEESFVGMGGQGEGKKPDLKASAYEVAVRAIQQSRKLRVDFRNEDGKLNRGKKLCPLRIWNVAGRSFLLAFRDGSEEVRAFDFGQLLRVEITEATFHWEGVLCADPCIGEGRAVYRNRKLSPEEVELEFEQELESELLDRPLHESQVLTRTAGRIRCRLRAPISEALVYDLIRFGGRMRIVRPRRLVRLLADRHRSAAAAIQEVPVEKVDCEPALPLCFD